MSSKKHARIIKHTIKKLGSKGYSKKRVLIELSYHVDKMTDDNAKEFLDCCIQDNNFFELLGLRVNYFTRSLIVAGKNSLPFDYSTKSFIKFCDINKNKIKEFLVYKSKLESEFLKGQHSKAIEILDEIDENFGVTLWSVDTRLSLLSLEGTTKDLTDFLKNNEDLNVTHLCKLLIKKHLSTGISTYMRQVLNNILMEYRGNNQSEYIDFASFMLVPYEFDKERRFINIFNYIQQLGYIDRYLCYRKLFSDYFSNGCHSDLDDKFVSFVEGMSENNIEIMWQRILDIINDSVNIQESNESNDIMEIYSSGNYTETIRLCKDKLSNNPINLTVAELLSKSSYYIYNENDIDLEQVTNIYGFSNNSILKRIILRLFMLHAEPARYEATIEELHTLRFKFYSLDVLRPVVSIVLTSFPFVNEKKRLQAACIIISTTSGLPINTIR